MKIDFEEEIAGNSGQDAQNTEILQEIIVTQMTKPGTISALTYPLRRFFARTIDFATYSLVWDFVLYIFIGVDYIDSNAIRFFNTFVVFALMILIEPILLSVFGTTLGKWIFGLSLTDADGQKLDYKSGLSRMWSVFSNGYGYNIPIYSLVRNYKCYIACKYGEELPWDKSFAYFMRDTKKYRSYVYIAAFSAIIALNVYISVLASCGVDIIDISHYETSLREGVSLEVEATYRTLSYTVSSDVIDYIVFDGYSGNISLEKKVDNKWFEVRKRILVVDASEAVSPKQSCSKEIRWKDYYGLNLDKGEYRLILTYWTSEFNNEFYNAVAYFTIS